MKNDSGKRDTTATLRLVRINRCADAPFRDRRMVLRAPTTVDQVRRRFAKLGRDLTDEQAERVAIFIAAFGLGLREREILRLPRELFYPDLARPEADPIRQINQFNAAINRALNDSPTIKKPGNCK